MSSSQGNSGSISPPTEEEMFAYVENLMSVDASLSTMTERIQACRQLVLYGRHPQLEGKWIKTEEGDPLEGSVMYLFAPKTQARMSICDHNGVRASVNIVNKEGRVRTDHYWICLHKNCTKESDMGSTKHLIQIQGSTSSNATKHLKDAHGIVSQKTIVSKRNADAFDQLIKDANPGFVSEPTRFLVNLFGIAACQHAVPFAFFKSTVWNLAMHHIPIPGAGSAMQNLDIRQTILEQYLYLKTKMRKEITQVKSWYGIPCFCLIIDLYKSPINKVKTICLLPFGLDESGHRQRYSVYSNIILFIKKVNVRNDIRIIFIYSPKFKKRHSNNIYTFITYAI